MQLNLIYDLYTGVMLVNMKIDRRTLFVVGQKFLFIIFSHWIFSLELL